MSQVSQQLFMEQPQDCRAWEEMWAAGRSPGELSLETVEGNVNPQARSKQSSKERTATLGGFILDQSFPSGWAASGVVKPNGWIRHDHAHFWKNTSTMLPISMVLGWGLAAGWDALLSPNSQRAPQQSTLNKCCQMFLIFSSANVNVYALEGRG